MPMKHARAVPTPAPEPPDPRQMTIDGATSAPTRKPTAKAMPTAHVAEMAKRAVERRGVVAGRVPVRLTIKQSAAEALTGHAIRETRNLEDVAAEILGREAGR